MIMKKKGRGNLKKEEWKGKRERRQGKINGEERKELNRKKNRIQTKLKINKIFKRSREEKKNKNKTHVQNGIISFKPSLNPTNKDVKRCSRI